MVLPDEGGVGLSDGGLKVGDTPRRLRLTSNGSCRPDLSPMGGGRNWYFSEMELSSRDSASLVDSRWGCEASDRSISRLSLFRSGAEPSFGPGGRGGSTLWGGCLMLLSSCTPAADSSWNCL